MKRLLCFLLTCGLLLSLVGCSLEANPDITTQPSGSPHTETTVPTQLPEPFATVQTLEAWEDNEVRALVPTPPGKISGYDDSGLYIGLTKATREDLEEYCQQLLDAGFDQYYTFEEYYQGESNFVFHGRNAAGLVVSVDSKNRLGKVPGSSYLYIRDFRPLESTADGEPWGADAFQQVLPDPGFPYVSAQLLDTTYDEQATRFYSVSFVYAMGYTDFKEYAEKLRSQGFVYKETENDSPFQDQYSFSAENSEGYLVHISHASGYPYLTLVEPGMEGAGRDWDDEGYRSCFPDPGCADFSERNTSYINGGMFEYTLKGMDQEGLKAYAQTLREMGFAQTLAEKDDPDAGTYLFAACGVGSMENGSNFQIQLFVRLSYDPAQTLKDGSPYCLMEISTSPFPENVEVMKAEAGLRANAG